MAVKRVSAKTTMSSIVNKARDYFSGKAKQTELEKKNKKLNEEIKELFEKNKLEEIELPDTGKRLVLQKIEKSSMDEESLLKTIEELIQISEDDEEKEILSNLIFTKKCIDHEELETLIYNGTLSASDLEDCVTTRIVTQLKFLNIQKKEDE